MTTQPSTRFKRLFVAAAAVAASQAASLPAQAESVVGLTTTNALVTFDSTSPMNASLPIDITGLMLGEQILGIDLRPATGALFGLASSGRVYTLNPGTGAATFVSMITGASLSGTSFGVDFNPTVDRLRVTSNAGQNLRINVDTGAVIVDGALNGATTNLSASAYTNNFAGATRTTLFGIGSAADMLYTQAPPNSGTLTAVGALGVDTSAVAGFDISGVTGMAYASLTNGDTGKSSFYTISLATGAASLVGALGYNGNAPMASPLLDITVAAIPEPQTYAMMLAGLLGIGCAARCRSRG